MSAEEIAKEKARKDAKRAKRSKFFGGGGGGGGGGGVGGGGADGYGGGGGGAGGRRYKKLSSSWGGKTQAGSLTGLRLLEERMSTRVKPSRLEEGGEYQHWWDGVTSIIESLAHTWSMFIEFYMRGPHFVLSTCRALPPCAYQRHTSHATPLHSTSPARRLTTDD